MSAQIESGFDSSDQKIEPIKRRRIFRLWDFDWNCFQKNGQEKVRKTSQIILNLFVVWKIWKHHLRHLEWQMDCEKKFSFNKS